MINSHQVEPAEVNLHPLHPPVKLLGLQFGPVVVRVPPALSSFRKVVRRDAGDDIRLALFIKLEVVTVSPDIRAVVRYEDGHVAKHGNPALVGFLPDAYPEVKQTALLSRCLIDLLPVGRAEFVQRGCFPVFQRRRPFEPGGMIEVRF